MTSCLFMAIEQRSDSTLYNSHKPVKDKIASTQIRIV